MAQIGWLVDLTKCVGCHACSVACKAENNTAPLISPLTFRNGKAVAVNYRHVLYRWGGTFPSTTLTFVTMACNHCYEPACMKSCPVGAISKRSADGVVLIDYDKCIGCKYCAWSCPYGAPQFNETTKKVEKCTFCVHRIDGGVAVASAPACVTTCAGRALSVVTSFSQSNSGLNAPTGFASKDHTLPAVQFTT